MKIATYLAAGICFFLAIYDFFLQGELTRWNIVAMVCGVALVVLPQVEWLKAGLTGVEYVTKARKYRDDAEKAAMLAQIYYKILSAVGSLPHKPAFVETFTTSLDRAARSGSSLTREDVDEAEREAGEISCSYLEGAPGGQEQVLISLERSGLLQRMGEGKELQAYIVPPKKRSLIVDALAYK